MAWDRFHKINNNSLSCCCLFICLQSQKSRRKWSSENIGSIKTLGKILAAKSNPKGAKVEPQRGQGRTPKGPRSNPKGAKVEPQRGQGRTPNSPPAPPRSG